MFGKRLFRIVELVLKLTNTIQVSVVKYDKQKRCLYTDFEPKTKQNVYANLCLICGWFIGICIQTHYFYKQNDLARLNLALAFVSGSLVFITLLTFTAFYPTSVCRAVNGLLKLFQHLHRKTLKFVNFTNANTFIFSIFRLVV